MTIDERIEALTQSVELLSLMHQDNEKRNIQLFSQMADAITRLVAIAEDHGQRLDNLEGRQ